MIENGFVKFPREIVVRPWFGESATLTVYVFLLLNAAFKDIERDGYTIYKGQYITSVKMLADICRLTVRQTRTALSHLQKTKDIAIRSTPQFSIITVNSMADGGDGAKRADTLGDTLVAKQNDNRSRSKEEIKEEYKEEVAAPPAPTFANDDEQRAALEAKYGSEAVTKYEKKFLLWIQKKKLPNVPMYPTIAKWLAQDYGEYYQASPVEKPAVPPSSIDIDEFDAAVLKQYKRHKSVQD